MQIGVHTSSNMKKKPILLDSDRRLGQFYRNNLLDLLAKTKVYVFWKRKWDTRNVCPLSKEKKGGSYGFSVVS